MLKFKKGFTLIELMFVIGLISILTVLGSMSYSNYSQRARDARRRVDMQQLRAALELFRSNNPQGIYPSINQYNSVWCPAAGANRPILVCQGLLAAIPRDPRNVDYIYSAIPGGCTNTAPNFCTSYTLAIPLEGGGTYTLTPTSIN